MSDVELRITFEAPVYRRKRLGAHRYGVALYADRVYTGLVATGLTKDEALEQARFMVDQGADLLIGSGLYNEVYRAVYAQRAYQATGLHVGDTVSLREAIAHVGLKGGHFLVKRIDLAMNGTDADEYPVVIEVRKDGETFGVPLDLKEIEFVSSPYEQAQVSA